MKRALTSEAWKYALMQIDGEIRGAADALPPLMKLDEEQKARLAVRLDHIADNVASILRNLRGQI